MSNESSRKKSVRSVRTSVGESNKRSKFRKSRDKSSEESSRKGKQSDEDSTSGRGSSRGSRSSSNFSHSTKGTTSHIKSQTLGRANTVKGRKKSFGGKSQKTDIHLPVDFKVERRKRKYCTVEPTLPDMNDLMVDERLYHVFKFLSKKNYRCIKHICDPETHIPSGMLPTLDSIEDTDEINSPFSKDDVSFQINLQQTIESSTHIFGGFPDVENRRGMYEDFDQFDIIRQEHIEKPPTKIMSVKRLWVKVIGVYLGNIESPLVITMSIHDVSNGTRMSEDFYVHTDPFMKIENPVDADPELMGTMGIFDICERNENLYLFTRISRVETIENLSNIDILDTPLNYLTPLYWSALPLGDFNNLPIKLENLQPAKTGLTDAQIYEFITESSNKNQAILNSSPFTDLSISYAFESFQSDHEVPGCVSPSLNAVLPYSEASWKVSTTHRSNVVQEIQNFFHYDVYDKYVNNLYIYPESISLKKKNLMIQVSFRDGYNDISDRIYGKTNQKKFVPFINSSISEKGLCSDQFKISLPVISKPEHHIVFKFFTVDTSKGKKTNIGTGFLRILENGTFKLHKRTTISIYNSLPDNYLDIEMPHMKKTFEFRLVTVSSINTLESKIRNYFNLNLDDPSKFIKRSKYCQELVKANPLEIWRFFPTIMEKLLRQLCTEKDNESLIKIMHTLLQLVQLVQNSPYDNILYAYLGFVFEDKKGIKTVHEVIVPLYTTILQDSSDEVYITNTTWFVFSLIIRSMSLYSYKKSKAKIPRISKFDLSYLKSIRSLLKSYNMIFLNNAQNMVYCGFFLRNLFSLIEPRPLFAMINALFELSSNGNESVYVSKLLVMELLSKYEYILLLDFPESLSPIQISEFSDIVEYSYAVKDRHFFSGLLLNFIEESYENSNLLHASKNRAMSIKILREMLQMHEFDEALQGYEFQQKISSIYFPYFILVINTLQARITTLKGEEKNNWLIVFLYLTKYCDRNIFVEWMKNEEVKNKRLFFLILEECQRTFKDNSDLESQIQLSVLSSITTYIVACREKLAEGTGESLILVKILTLFRRLLMKNRTEFVKTIHDALLLFWTHCSKGVFSANETVGESLRLLVLEIFIQMSSPEDFFRIPACETLLVLLSTENAKYHVIMQGYFTVAVADLVGEASVQFEYLKKSLLDIQETTESNITNSIIKDTINSCIEIALLLLKYGEDIASHGKDQEKLADIYSNISKSLKEYPGIRLVWIDNMAKLHNSNEDFVEAGQCKMLVSCLIIQHLRALGLWQLPESFEYFESVCPNIRILANQVEFEAVGGEYNWTVKEVIVKIKEAIELFEKSTQYELAIRSYSILSNIYVHENDYDNMIINLENHAELSEKLTNPTFAGSRLNACYFRIGFFGSLWGKYNGREYIYKKSQRYNLTVMKNELIDTYKDEFGEENLTILLTNEPVDVSKLDDDKVYIQMAGVKPYVSTAERLKKVGDFEINFGLNKLLFEATLRGEIKIKEDDLEHQRKKKTIFVTKFSFPHIKRRVRVDSQELVVLSPIENATELIKLQTSQIQTVVQKKPPSINSLQQVIQGSVVPMVNPGPLLICNIFLNPDRITAGEFDPILVMELVQSFEDFLRFCFLGLAQSKYIMEEKNRALQNMLDSSYADLKVKINDTLEAAKDAVKKL